MTVVGEIRINWSAPLEVIHRNRGKLTLRRIRWHRSITGQGITDISNAAYSPDPLGQLFRLYGAGGPIPRQGQNLL